MDIKSVEADELRKPLVRLIANCMIRNQICFKNLWNEIFERVKNPQVLEEEFKLYAREQ